MDGWMDRKKIDGWLNGYIFFEKDRWMDRKTQKDGWMDRQMDGRMDIKNMVGWTGKHKMMVGWI